MNFNEGQLDDLRDFIGACEKSPEVLYLDELSFFRQYLQSLGANIPPKPKAAESTEEPKAAESTEEPKETASPQNEEKPMPPPPPAEPKADEEELIESDLDIDMEGIIEEDADEGLPMGDENKEVSEQDVDKASEKRSEAMSLMSDCDYEKAIKIFGEAIEINPSSAALYAKRANCLLKTNKPNACIRDCDRAIKMNPDNAQAYKFRGRANRLLGRWEEAVTDLGTACKIDYDEQANEWLKEVQPNAKKVHEHKRKYERIFEEKKLKDQQERIRKIREEREKAAQEQARGSAENMPGQNFADFASIFNDPDIVQALKDPEVAEAFKDICANPANIMKYQSNPKVSTVLAKVAEKMGTSGQFGGMPGGMPGMPGGMPGFPGGMPGFPGGFS